MITYFLRAAAAVTSAYRVNFRWDDHIPTESSSTNDLSVQIELQMA